MERTLVFRNSQTDRTTPLQLPFIHGFYGLSLSLVLTRTGQRLNGNQVLQQRLKTRDWSGSTLGTPKWILVKETILLSDTQHTYIVRTTQQTTQSMLALS